MAKIDTLPPEIIQLIVEALEGIVAYERLTGRDYGRNLPTGGGSRRRRRERERNGGGGPANDDDDDEDDGFPRNPRDAVMAMFGGLLGLGGQGGGAARAPTGANPAPRPAQTAPPPAAPTTNPGAATTGYNQFNAQNDSDEEMPALETVGAPSTPAPASSTPRTRPEAASPSAIPRPTSNTSAAPRPSSNPPNPSTPTPAAHTTRPADPVASAYFSLEQVTNLLASSTPPPPATSSSSNATAANGKGKAPASAKKKEEEEDDDDDMPPLEFVTPSTDTTFIPLPKTEPTPAPAPQAKKKEEPEKKKKEETKKPKPVYDSEEDEMPHLEDVSKPSISTSNAKGKEKAPEKKPVETSANANGTGKGKAPVVPESQSKKPVEKNTSAKEKTSVPPPFKPEPKRKPSFDSDSDEMPALEPVRPIRPLPTQVPPVPSVPSTSTSNLAPAPPRPKDPVASAEYSIEQVESLNNPAMVSPVPATSSTSQGGVTSTSPKAGKDKEEENGKGKEKATLDASKESKGSDQPPPSSLNGTSAPDPSTSTSTPATAPRVDPITNMFSNMLRGKSSAAARPSAGSPGAGGGGGPSDDDDDDEWEDEYRDAEDYDGPRSDEGEDEEDSEDEDSEDDDESDSEISSIASEDCTYEDGLPADPLLPLLFVSRPFLHAARKALYKKVHVATAFQARMLLDSIRERKHAARTEDEEPVVDEQTATIEELGKEGGKKEENKKEGGENALASMIKHLYLEASGQVGMARGGGKVFVELIERCRKVEGLEIKPMFPRSATKPLLKALNNLPFLEALDIQSSTSDEYPFLVTTPRIFEIQKSSPNLNALTVQYLKSGYEADEDEDAEMWDQADREEDLERLEAEEEENEADDRPSEMHKTDRKVDRVKQKGLKALSLFDFDVSSEEIAIILRHSKKTIVELALQRPGTSFGRYDAALVFLRFGHTLTHVNLAFPSTWSPKPALTQPFKPNPPMKPKGYVTGQPSHELLTKVAAYHYILDAILPFLPNLKNLGWNGPIASSYAFALMPPSLKTVSWGHCTSVEPRILARLLNKTTTRNTTFTRADGSKGTKSVKTKIAKGLQCASVNHDDMSWNDEEIRLLDSAMKDRGCCFHLSSEGAAGLFGELGGLGGLAAGMGMGGGVGAMGIPIPIPLGMGVGGFGRH